MCSTGRYQGQHNNRLQSTTHKLWHGNAVRSLLSYFIQSVGRRLNRDVVRK